ncbi:MAG TPA: putative porin, partial [Novosphingobium sp.]|nr:putative porin [Novosphingobium sp.]
LVKKGILGRAEADVMIAQANAQAAQVRAATQAAQSASQQAQVAEQTSKTAVAAASPASAAPGTSVRYVPDFVRDQIKEEVRQEVLADAKKEGLVGPDALPEWVRGIKITGDFRFRDEGHYFDKRNASNLVDVGAINGGNPYDPNNAAGTNPPIRNTNQNRNILRIRARLGLEADIAPEVTFYTRVATGSQTNPDSTNQTLGGYFTDKGIWLDRAYLDIHPFKSEDAHLFLGRMANPFHLPELVWDDDVNLDGAAVSYARGVGHGLSLHATGGAFPLSYAPDQDPTTGLLKTADSQGDRWLFAGQAGVDWKANDKLRAEFDVAYYDYQNVAGKLSPACLNTSAFCITDYSRPGYLQAGNTLFALRDLTTTDPNNTSSPQYYGLASAFRVLDVSGAVDYAFTDKLNLNLTGHFAHNLAYSASDILARGYNPASGLSQIVNNNETCSVALQGGVCPAGKSIFQSGGNAWLIRATLGTPKIDKFGDWRVTASYRHIDPDALLDAFTDQDFHLGGTNAKGWTIGGEYGLFKRTSIGLRWMSAEQVSGPPLKIDLMQADLNVHF